MHTDYQRSSRREPARSGLADVRCFCLPRLRARDVNTAPEVCAILDHDARGLYVADQIGAFAQDDPLGSLDVPLYRAGDNDLICLDVSVRFSVDADREAILRFQLANHFAVDLQFLTAENIALDLHGCADDGAACGSRLRNG